VTKTSKENRWIDYEVHNLCAAVLADAACGLGAAAHISGQEHQRGGEPGTWLFSYITHLSSHDFMAI